MNKKQLWDSILQQAISGKLVPQLDSEPAVEQIDPAPDLDDVPFALPEKWKWVKLGELLPFGVSAQVSPEQIPIGSWVLGLEDIQSHGSLISKQLTKNKVGSNKNIFKAGNVLYGKMRPYLNKVIIADSDGFCSTEIFVLDVNQASRPLYSFFLRSLLQSPYFVTFATNHSRGQKPRLETKAGQQVFVPLPPLEEQRRIVAKLDELKPLVDQFGEAYDKLSELEADFPRKLKASILQAAMQGKLVPQLDSELAVEQIGPTPDLDEVPFELPEKWKWVALEDLFQFVDYRGKTPIKSASGVRLITSSNVRKGYLDHTRCEYISIDEYQSRQSRGVSHKGDILFTTEAPLGNVALADLDVFSVGQRVITLKSKGLALNECFVWFLLSNYFQTEILKQATGSTVQGIKAARLKKLVLPLPPIEEQRRIVERIEHLFAEVDKMSACKAP